MKIRDLGPVIRAHEKAGNAIFLKSAPGIGKSAFVAQLCEEDKIECVDIRLSLLNPVDLRGIPIVKGDKVEWVPPIFLVKKGPCRFFLDEIVKAPPATQSAAYQWVLDKRIGEWRMDTTIENGRPRQTIIAAGNRLIDRVHIHQMDPALNNRFAHIEIEPDLEDWKEWAWKHGVHRSIINFLSFTSRVPVGLNDKSSCGLLFFFDPDKHKEGPWPSPRSWEQVSRFIDANPKMRFHGEALGGMISQVVAEKFVAFVKIEDNLPNADEIIRGKTDIKPPTEVSAQYAFCGALTGALIRAKADERLNVTKNAVTYCVKHWASDAEFATLVMKDYARTPEWKEVCRQIVNTKEWRDFTKEFGTLLLD